MSNNNTDSHGSLGGGHDQQGPTAPLMNRTMDELLAAEFPPGIESVAHADAGLNNSVHNNIMEGLDELFSDDFPPVATASGSNPATNLAPIHLQHPQTHPQHSAVQHSQAMAQHQQRVQHPQVSGAIGLPPSAVSVPMSGHISLPLHQQSTSIPSTPTHLSSSPQVSPALANVTPTIHTPPHIQGQQPQQILNRPPPQPQPLPLNQQLQLQQMQQQPQLPGGAALGLGSVYQPTPTLSQTLPVQQQAQQQSIPRPQMTAVPQSMAPGVSVAVRPQSSPMMPNGQPLAVPAATPVSQPAIRPPVSTPNTPPTPAAVAGMPIAQPGTPLHYILSRSSPAIANELRNIFAQLQRNAVSPNEFLARAQVLLDPEQFAILDQIRRRHVSRPAGDTTPLPTIPGAGPTPPTPVAPGLLSSTLVPTVAAPVVVPPGVARPAQQPTQTPGLPTPAVAAPSVMPALPGTSAPSQNPSPAGTSPSVAAAALVATPGAAPVAAGSATSQSAPVRKRTTDVISSTAAVTDSKTGSKRIKTEHQQMASGTTTGSSTSSTAASTPSAFPSSLPATPGPSTPAGVPSPNTGALSRVSLPGQNRPAATVPMGSVTSGASGSGGAGGAATAAPRASAPAAGSSTGTGAAGGVEKVNYDSITDVMGYVGMDLREESDNIMRDNDSFPRFGGNSDGQDRTKIQNFVNMTILKARADKIATSHRLQPIEPDVLTYLALATQERIRGMAEQMVHACKHRYRTLATAPPPMYDEDHAMYRVGVNQDVKKQLLAIERVEREEETKRKEQIAERERRLAAGEDLDENGAGGAGGGGAAGGGAAGGAAGGASSPLPSGAGSSSGGAAAAAAASSPSASGTSARPPLSRSSTLNASSSGAAGSSSGSSAHPPSTLTRTASTPGGGSMVLPPSTVGRPSGLRDTSRRVNIKDALFCLERDRGGGGGEGSGQRVLIKSYAKLLK
ncbi:hypothetical protein BGW38_003622 [Lunasporangiospora selenospora]|uniref:Transcription initiation factor TFIID subunit 4 n=1 Tax=Lunasporangiospora selenospora TaxID=979761 RepID=A0A9P6KJ03_9FUNG|nr:hypothetical protein BGW38_003622 [Lunasporangiospora selenospora]